MKARHPETPELRELIHWMVANVAAWGSEGNWAREAGTYQSTINRIINRETLPRQDTLDKLSAASRVGPLPVGAFRAPALSAKGIHLQQDGEHYDRPLTNDGNAAHPRSVRVLEVSTPSAGIGEGIVGDVLAEWEVPTEWLLKMVGVSAVNHLRIMAVDDDGMAGTLEKGDKVLVDFTQRLPSPAGIYMIVEGSAAVPRRLEYANAAESLVSVIRDNTRYPSRERDLASIKILGKVVARWHPI